MATRKIYIPVFIVFIIATGIFKNQVSWIYSVPINYFLSFLGVDSAKLTQLLSVLAKDDSIDNGLGTFLFYPTYLVLHFALIHNLFYDNRVLKMKLIYGLSIIFLGLGVFSVIFRFTGLIGLYQITFHYFELVSGRPLILFLIEGGGMIYQFIENSEIVDRE